MGILQNVKVKLFLQSSVFTILSWYNKLLNHNKNLVLFYINTNFRESNKTLFDYMISHGYNNVYKIVCSCNNPDDYKKNIIKNVKFTNRFGGLMTFFKAGNVFYSIGKIPILPGKNQIVMQMWHGIPIKAANEGWKKGHIWKRQHYSYLLSPSKHYAPIFSKLFSVPLDKIFIGGYPRCDALFEDNPQYDFGEYKKLILWTPTFRKSIDPGMKENANSNTIVPVIDKSVYKEFDSFLSEHGLKVLVKLHPYQNLEGLNFPKMNNFILMTHQEMVSRNIDLYRLCAQSDALITDYSSIVFDYLLLNKPVAFTLDDMTEYKEDRGFVFDNIEDYMPGPHITTIAEMKSFCKDLVDGNDSYKLQREQVNRLVNDYRNGGYCKRILDTMGIFLTK